MENIKAFFNQLNCAKVISNEIDYSKYVALDLSSNNSELGKHKLETAQDYEKFIQRLYTIKMSIYLVNKKFH